jgi:hypothetical protein
MGLRQHLVDAHTANGEFHSACMKAHDAYHKTLDDGPEKEFHKSMRDAHMAACEKCVSCARHASQLDDSIPTDARGVPKVAKSALATGEERFNNIVDDGVHLVPRFGVDPAEIEKANASGTIPDSVKHIFQRNAGQ